MIRFFQDMAVNPLLLYGLAGGALGGLACGLIGPYVITRRIVFLSGAVAHMVVGGMGAVLFLRQRFPAAMENVDPLYGAAAAAVAAALIMGLVEHFARERLDTLIGALWAVGMAVGLILIRFTPGYHVEIFSYLFGNIAVVSGTEVKLVAVLDGAILLTVLLFHKRLVAVCLDEEYALLQGVRVLAVKLVLLVLVALTTVALIRVVGLILVIALLSLPAAASALYTRSLAVMMALSTVLCILLTTVPRIAVYGTRLSPEPVIVLSAGGVYLLSLLGRRLLRGRNASPAAG